LILLKVGRRSLPIVAGREGRPVWPAPGEEEDGVTSESARRWGAERAAEGGVTAGAFRSLMEAFQRVRVPVTADGAAAAERHREEVKALIESHVGEARWRALMHEARLAAERGEAEYLLLRFSSETCTDRGRAIIQQEPQWPETLTGDAEAVYRHWHRELAPRGFTLTARVLAFPKGFPGEVGLFLRWDA
jgi:hypothetical protein